MSYARLSEDSDIYVFESERDDGSFLFHCHWCRFSKKDTVSFDTLLRSPFRMLLHVLRHVFAGHRVPRRAMTRLALRCLSEELGS